MCLIVASIDPKTRLTRRFFKEIWSENSDGFGVAYVREGKVRIRKPYFSVRNAWKAYSKACARSDGPVVAHWRFATSGMLDKRNTHPHPVKCSSGERLALVHNGVLPGGTNYRSDTVLWSKIAFNGRSHKQLYSPRFLKYMGNFLGGSKVALLSPTGSLALYNEEYGEWSDNFWFSVPHWAYAYEGRLDPTLPSEPWQPYEWKYGRVHGL